LKTGLPIQRVEFAEKLRVFDSYADYLFSGEARPKEKQKLSTRAQTNICQAE
jgi:hypothetical protein